MHVTDNVAANHQARYYGRQGPIWRGDGGMAGDKLEKLEGKVSGIFGSWVEGPMSFLVALALLVVAGVAAYQVAEHFSHPEIRWVICSVILVLSVGSIFLKKRVPTVIDRLGSGLTQ